MFSVIVPLYNKEQYIENCIRSVINQTYSLFELLIINDGSTDNSLSIVERFKDARISIIDQENLGVSAARNRGVENAKFDFIAFLDADDWWHPTFLAELNELIYAYPYASLYGSNYYYVKHGQYRLEQKGFSEDFIIGYINYIDIYKSSFCAPINCSFVVVRKSEFLQIGGFRNILKFGEDFDLWIRLAIKSKVAYINKPLAYSNQDVELSNRAIGNYELYKPINHFIFNLSYLLPLENTSFQLKYLLDGLRVRSLLPYYLKRQYIEEVKVVLAEVDFYRQPYYYQILYRSPIELVQLYFKTMQLVSIVKQKTLQFLK